MENSFEKQPGEIVRHVSRVTVVSGILLIIGGIIATTFSLATTLITLAFIGTLVVVGGAVKAYRAIRDRAFWPDLFVAILYGVTGGLILARPGITAVTVTVMFASLFIMVGFTRIVAAIAYRYRAWGLSIVGGLISAAFGVFLLVNVPGAALWLLGTLVGVELIVSGIDMLVIGRAGQVIVSRVEEVREHRRAA